MADRRAQILALLATRFDNLPEPVRHDPQPAGFVHRTLAPTVCPTCEGLDDQRSCPTCRGSGQVEVWRTRDPYATDRVTPYGLEATGKLGHVPARDAEIDRLADQTAPPPATELDLVAAANEHPYGWERARAAMYAQFDFAALDVALDLLHHALPGVAASSERGLAFLEQRLPDPIRAPTLHEPPVHTAARGRGADPRARAQRDSQVRAMLAQGATVDEVAAKVGLSAKQLRRIANRADDEAAA